MSERGIGSVKQGHSLAEVKSPALFSHGKRRIFILLNNICNLGTSTANSSSPREDEDREAKKDRSMDARRTGRLLPRVATITLAVCGVLAAVFMLFQVGNTPSSSASQQVQVVAVSNANADVVKTPSRSVKEEASIKIKIKAAAAATSVCELQDCKVVPGDANICGSDGKVYYNECLFQNAQCRNSTLSKVTDWNGYRCPTTCTEHIVCKEIGKFLCGSDGNVYFGYCLLYEAQCVDKALQEIACPQGLIQFPPRSHRP